MTFHAACGRLLRRDAARAGYSPSFTIYDQADQLRLVKACTEELELDPKRFAPRAVHARISRAKERLLTAEAYAEEVSTFFEQAAANVYALYEKRLHDANAMDFDDLIMRGRAPARARRGGAHRLAGPVALRHGRRVPGHEPRPVPARVAPLGAPPEHRGGRRPGSVDLRLPRRRHQKHRRVRARLPGRPRRHARAELPLDAVDSRRRERGDRPQPQPQAEAALVGARRRRAGAGRRDRRRAFRGAVRRRRDRRGDRRRCERGRHRRLLPGQCAVARARGSARPPGRAVPRDRRPALLRAGRGEGCDRVSPGDRQPGRRGVAQEDREPPAAGDRPDDPRAAGEARVRHGLVAHGGDRARGVGVALGGRRGEGARVRGADGRPAGRGGRVGARGPAREDARVERLHGHARGRAHLRVAGPGREPPGAGRGRARVRGHGARRRPRSTRSSRRSRSSPTRTRSTSSARTSP